MTALSEVRVSNSGLSARVALPRLVKVRSQWFRALCYNVVWEQGQEVQQLPVEECVCASLAKRLVCLCEGGRTGAG